jgi:hypothetical protein
VELSKHALKRKSLADRWKLVERMWAQALGPKIDNQEARVEVSKLPQREISEMKENKIHEDKSPISCEKKHEKKKKKSEQARRRGVTV